MPLTAGTRLGPYEILSPIGAGGMGEVYRARDTRLHRDVAIKVLPDDMRDDVQRLARFTQEARATAALNHPNILAVFDVATEGPTPYLVSELLEGATLGARLRATSGRMATSRALDYARQLAQALTAAHGRGIVHRDLKPDNIFLTDDGRVKVLDFGLARIVAPAGGTVTTTSGDARTDQRTVLGTLGYMAPEQLRGLAVDARGDLFSLGAVLFEMLAGRRSFEGDNATDTISAVLSKDAPDLMSSPEYPIAPALARLVRRCLEKEPAARFQTANDLAFALEAVAGSSMPGSGPVAAVEVAHERTGRRWSATAVAAVTALVTAAVTLVGVTWWTKGVPPGPTAEMTRFEMEPPSDMVVGVLGAAPLPRPLPS